MTEEAQPQEHAPAPKGQLSMVELFQQADDWYLQLKRVVALHESLSLSHRTATGALQRGERQKGMPILSMTASVDGRTPIECAMDLKHLDPNYVGHVLIPLINMTSFQIDEALDEILIRVQDMKKLLAPPPPAAAQPAAQQAA